MRKFCMIDGLFDVSISSLFQYKVKLKNGGVSGDSNTVELLGIYKLFLRDTLISVCKPHKLPKNPKKFCSSDSLENI